MKRILSLLFLVGLFIGGMQTPDFVVAQTFTPRPRATTRAATSEAEATVSGSLVSPSPEPTATPTPEPPPPDITQKSEETLGPLEEILQSQQLGPLSITNAFKHAIRNAVNAGVPANTIVLLLLLPLVAAIIAGARHLVGLRGFGIFLPAALSVVFLATGPIIGLGLFLVIVVASTLVRLFMRKFKMRLQYLPRMAMMLWFVVLAVLGVLFSAPFINQPGLGNVSIFPVLVLVLLAEDFSKVQMGKNIRTAINLTTETLILALVSFIFLTFQPLQEFALLNPETLLVGVLVFDYLIGKYVGLRFLEYWRFRKLISA